MSISKKKKLRNRKSRKGKNFLYRLYGSYGTAKEQRKGKRNRKSRKPKNFLNRLYGGYGRPNILKETTAELTQEESDRMERERRAIERPYSPLAPNWMGNMEAARARKAAAAERALAARAANEAEEMAVDEAADEAADEAVAAGVAARAVAEAERRAADRAAAVAAAEKGTAAAIQRRHDADINPWAPRDGKGRVQTFHSYETEAAAAARAEREARAEMAARAEREARAEMAARAAAAGFAGPGTRRSQHKSYSPSPYTTVDQELERCNSILMVVQRQLEELQNSVIVNP